MASVVFKTLCLALVWQLAAASVLTDESYLLEPLGEFRVTYYWVAQQDARYDGLAPSEPLLDRDGGVLARVSRAFRKAIELEGTGRLRDGRVLNVAGRLDGQLRWVETEHPYGLGVESRPLQPFLSVATDPELIPSGTLLYLEALEGFLRPSGEPHTGLIRADDIGRSIRGKHIDIFIGTEDNLEKMERQVCPSLGRLSLHAATTPQQPAPAHGQPTR